jgi:hypothetical protein
MSRREREREREIALYACDVGRLFGTYYAFCIKNIVQLIILRQLFS